MNFGIFHIISGNSYSCDSHTTYKKQEPLLALLPLYFPLITHRIAQFRMWNYIAVIEWLPLRYGNAGVEGFYSDILFHVPGELSADIDRIRQYVRKWEQ